MGEGVICSCALGCSKIVESLEGGFILWRIRDRAMVLGGLRSGWVETVEVVLGGRPKYERRDLRVFSISCKCDDG